ncbi:tyrosine-type recombinase/integrase [Streptomyces klenkii]|uniref:tyrosine-type recombinase/integrase n=1 Tax=Streptomyces klenkii TaxID=1420899 RepID=UPI0036E9FE18
MPHIEWRGGTCRVKWWTGEYHANGRKRYESQGGFTDEDVALDHGRDKEYEVRHGLNVTRRDGEVSMPQWLDQWIESLDLGPLTERNYKSAIRVHIRPYFKDMTVGEVNLLHVRAFYKHLNQVLSPASTLPIKMVFRLVMDDAVAVGLRRVTPVERTRRRGRYKKKPLEKKVQMPISAVDRLALNAQTLWGFQGYVFFWTMAFTGMRPAELYALQRSYCHPAWPASDPDPERRDESIARYAGTVPMPAIRVQQQVQYVDSELTFLPPKYESYRTLVIPDFLAGLLEKLLVSHDYDWVFPARMGGCLGRLDFDSDYWREIADGAVERGGRKPRPAVPEVHPFAGKRLYLIRHGAKEWLDEDGHSRAAVEGRMGHELQGVERTYSNVTPAMEAAIRERLQQRWETFQKTRQVGSA